MITVTFNFVDERQMEEWQELAEDCMQNLIDSDLSKKTKATYEQCLGQLVRYFPGVKSIVHVLSEPDRMYRKLMQVHGNRGSIRNYLIACLSLFKHTPELKHALPNVHARLTVFLKEVASSIDQHYKSNKPSEKQMDQYIDYSVALAKYEKLTRGSTDAILLGLYVLLPPKRNDYWDARVYKHHMPSPDVGNYFVINHRVPDTSTKQSWLVMNDYKTAKSYGQLREVIPERLAYEIHLSLKREPRTHLFLSANGHPFNSANSFCKYANNRLGLIFNKHVTLTMFRHAYCTKIRNSDLSLGMKQQLARSMGHSTMMQDAYSYKEVYCAPRRLKKTCERITTNTHGMAVPTDTMTETTPLPPPIDKQWLPMHYASADQNMEVTYNIRRM